MVPVHSEQPHENDEKELAHRMQLGIKRRPRQAFGEYYIGRNASCALGAAYEGLYPLPSEVGPLRPKELEHLFDCLEFSLRQCPSGCKKSVPLAAMIVHLNDDHRWSREQIAAWLEENGPSAS